MSDSGTIAALNYGDGVGTVRQLGLYWLLVNKPPVLGATLSAC
jgi:hypothetical protein